MRCAADLVHAAERLAERAHTGQTDKAGEPYIGHVRRVAAAVRPQEPIFVATALLHDVIEDSEVTLDDLSRQGFPVEVVTAVELLTRDKQPSAGPYYERIASNPIALAVKIADVADNTNLSRLARLDIQTRQRLMSKYRNALLALNRPDLAAQLDQSSAP
ncbi:HD domain-containing protein [Mycobacterium kyorinense]|uniref:HD domain-containing protein n=1 Tax=Mycobacterium kyorinense TaxID=487514 RepID=UPI001153F0FF